MRCMSCMRFCMILNVGHLEKFCGYLKEKRYELTISDRVQLLELVTEVIWKQDSGWFDNVSLMDDNQLPPRVLPCYAQDSRSREWLNKRWINSTQKDLMQPNISESEVNHISRDKQSWRHHVSIPSALHSWWKCQKEIRMINKW